MDAWFDANPNGPWRGYAEWHGDAVDALAEAIVAKRDADGAAERLGAFRAESGISIREGLDDIRTPFRLTIRKEPPRSVMLAFAEGWADSQVGALLGRSAIDQLTGLVTYDYLCARLGEIYSEPRDISSRCLLVVSAGLRGTSGRERVSRTVAVSRVVRDLIDQGETAGVLPNGLFVAIVDRGERLQRYLRDLTDGLAAVLATNDPVNGGRIWVEPLPQTHLLAEDLLLSLDAS